MFFLLQTFVHRGGGYVARDNWNPRLLMRLVRALIKMMYGYRIQARKGGRGSQISILEPERYKATLAWWPGIHSRTPLTVLLVLEDWSFRL